MPAICLMKTCTQEAGVCFLLAHSESPTQRPGPRGLLAQSMKALIKILSLILYTNAQASPQ